MPKKYHNFIENFLLGEKVAEMRIQLAKKYDGFIKGNEIDIKKYILLKNQDIFKNTLAGILGYVKGYYTTFCPFQSQLNNFDREIKGLTESAREGL